MASKKGYNKDLALLSMLDEQSLLGLLNQEMGSNEPFVDEKRIRLNAKYMANPDMKQVIDLAYAAIDGGEDASTVISELQQRILDPNDTSIPKIDPDSFSEIAGGVLDSSQAKSRSASSGRSGLEVLGKLGVPEFAPLLGKMGKTKKFGLPESPYSGVSKEQEIYAKNLAQAQAKTEKLQKETTRGPKTDWATVELRDLSKGSSTLSPEFIEQFQQKYGAPPPDLLRSGLDAGLGGKKIPVGKAADVGAKALTFLGGALQGAMVGGLPGGLALGGLKLGEVNKTGTGWGETFGSKTESPEDVKKRQALALIALKKNQQDIENQQQAAQEAEARQGRLSDFYTAGAGLTETPLTGNIFEKAAFAKGVYNQQKTAKANKALGPSEYDLTRLLLAKAMRD